MSSGKLAECGHPYDLLSKYLGPNPVEYFDDNSTIEKSEIPRDSFASMVIETGVDMARQLCRIATDLKK
jgi:hypothetical protein